MKISSTVVPTSSRIKLQSAVTTATIARSTFCQTKITCMHVSPRMTLFDLLLRKWKYRNRTRYLVVVFLISALTCVILNIFDGFPQLTSFDVPRDEWRPNKMAQTSRSSPPHYLKNISKEIARPFLSWTESRPLPCFEASLFIHSLRFHDMTRSTTGFLYMKPHKCASTTAASVTIRIARNVARRLHKPYDMCDSRFSHGDQRHQRISQWRNQRKLSSSSEKKRKNVQLENNDQKGRRKGTDHDGESKRENKRLSLFSKLKRKDPRSGVILRNQTDYSESHRHGSSDFGRHASDTDSLTGTSSQERVIQKLPLPSDVLQRYRRPELPMSHGNRFRNRLRDGSFLWTIVREPSARFASQYFFREVSFAGNEPTDENFRKFLFHDSPREYYLCMLSVKEPNEKFCQSPYSRSLGKTILNGQTEYPNGLPISDATLDSVRKVVNEYDFIGIMERFDESLVVLMMLLDLKLADILYLSSKKSGELFPRESRGRHSCAKVQPTNLTSEMRAFLYSDVWQRHILSDTVLYQAVNRSLDLTIDRLGRDQVKRNVALFQKAQNLATMRCQTKVRLPCRKEGEIPRTSRMTDCFLRDLGCGMTCLDEVADELQLW